VTPDQLRPAPQPTDQQEAISPEERRKRFIEKLRVLAENDPKRVAEGAVSSTWII
jgi:hypothetical protein